MKKPRASSLLARGGVKSIVSSEIDEARGVALTGRTTQVTPTRDEESSPKPAPGIDQVSPLKHAVRDGKEPNKVHSSRANMMTRTASRRWSEGLIEQYDEILLMLDD